METRYQRFGTTWLAATLAAITGLALLNVLVDPAGAYPALHLRCFEPLR